MKDKKANEVKTPFIVLVLILALVSTVTVMASAQTNGGIDTSTEVILFPTAIQPITYMSNITFDIISDNVGNNATTGFFTSTEVIDNETYYVINTSKPVEDTRMYVTLDNDTGNFLMKRKVTRMEGVEVRNLTFDPAYVMLDFPLYVGKNWTSTVNVTGMLVNETTGEEIPINTCVVESANITAKEDLTVPNGTIPCLVVEINCSHSHLRKYWISQMDNGIYFPKVQQYFSGIFTEELVLIDVKPTE